MIVGHIISSLSDGGAEAVLCRLCLADPANRHFVISLMGEGKYGAVLRQGGVSVHCLAMPQGRLTVTGVRHLWRLLRQHQPDVLQTWMYHADFIGSLVGSLAGIKKIYWGIRSGELLWTGGQRLTIILRLCNAALSWLLPTAILCNSARAAQIHRSIGFRGAKIRVIPNGIDIDVFRPDAALRESVRQEWHVPLGMTLLGAVGRYTPYKGYDQLIAALSLLKSQGYAFRCVLVGERMIDSNQAVASQLDGAGLSQHVRLAGPRTDIPAVMNALDVLVLSSVAEAFPSVLIEAMACGVPCVVTDVGDAKAIVGETGWVVPPRNPSALASGVAAALTVLSDQDALASRQRACRDRVVQHFTMARMVESYRSVWQDAHGSAT